MPKKSWGWVGRSDWKALASVLGIRGVGTASPRPGTGKPRHRARQGLRNTGGRGHIAEPLPLRGSAELVAEEEETRRTQKGRFAGANTHTSSPSPAPILAQDHPGGTPLLPPAQCSHHRAEDPPGLRHRGKFALPAEFRERAGTARAVGVSSGCR